jgi:hypothetical protein
MGREQLPMSERSGLVFLVVFGLSLWLVGLTVALFALVTR